MSAALVVVVCVVAYAAMIPGARELTYFIDDGLGAERAEDISLAVFWPLALFFLLMLMMAMVFHAWYAIFEGGWSNILTRWDKARHD